MADTPLPAAGFEGLDEVLRKYGKVWIWSILCATVAALSYRFGSAFAVQTWHYKTPSLLTTAIVMRILLAGPIAMLVSLYCLLRFLRRQLLPIFFSLEETPDPADGARSLYGAFGAIVVAVAVEVLGAVLMAILD
jgi:membrane protein required for beta-lactamase induction